MEKFTSHFKNARFIFKPILISAYFILSLTSFSFANNVLEQEILDKKISIKILNENFKEALKKISATADIKFSYSRNTIPNYDKINISINDETLRTVFEIIFKPYNINFEAIGNNIILRKNAEFKKISLVETSESSETSLSFPIKGIIKDQSGNPIANASVVLSSNKQGIATSSTGEFAIDAKEGDVIIISAIGFETVNFKIGKSDFVNIVLNTVRVKLDEVVVVGYGTQKRSAVTGAISSISGKDFENVPVSKISNSIIGRASGIFGNLPGGVPGSTSEIFIRGISTFRHSYPIYVIDGIVRSQSEFDLVDPNDIDNISILKDASAVAVYGSRGGNGVIILTTKRGNVQKPVFGYSAYFGLSRPTQVPDRLNSYEQALYLNDKLKRRNAQANDPRLFSDDELEIFKSGEINTDWFKLVKKDPIITQHNLRVNGGSDKLNYYMSVGYYYENGMFNNVDYNRINLRTNIDANVSKSFTISLNIDGNTQKSNRPYWPWDASNSATMEDFYSGILNQSSMSRAYVNGLPDGTLNRWHVKEVIDKGGYSKSTPDFLNGLLKLKYNSSFIKGLSSSLSFNYTNISGLIKTKFNRYPLYIFNLIGNNRHLVGDQVQRSFMAAEQTYDFIARNHSNSKAYTFIADINYNKNFGKSEIKGLVLYEQYESYSESFYVVAENPLSATVDQIFLTDPNPLRRSSNGSADESGRASVISRVNYSYDDKYLFEANLRYDGSSAFPDKNKWGLFPSASVGWVISKEAILKNSKVVKYLKLRGSYGISGNDRVGLSQWYSIFYVDQSVVFGSVAPTITPYQYANPNLSWEKIKQTNIGIDATLWDGKLSCTIDIFKKNTFDILLSPISTLPGTFGITPSQENIGIVHNKGFEVTIKHENSIGLFKYFISPNISYYRNKVIEYPEPPTSLPFAIKKGKPIDYIIGFESIGIARTDDDLKGTALYNGRAFELGDIIFKDQNNDGRITNEDVVVLSKNSIYPSTVFGVNFGASWKDFDISFLLQGVGGRKLIFPNREQWDNEAVLSIWNDHWTPDNINAKYPAVGTTNGTHTSASTFWLRNGNYTRLKSIEIGYTLPKRLLNKLGIKDLRFYLSGYNLFTFSKIKEYDPEFQSFKGAYQYPIMKNVNLGLNLSF